MSSKRLSQMIGVACRWRQVVKKHLLIQVSACVSLIILYVVKVPCRIQDFERGVG